MAWHGSHSGPTEQAKRAIKGMLAAGFKRSDFSVRTMIEKEGGTYLTRSGRVARSWHYGDAVICCYRKSEVIR